MTSAFQTWSLRSTLALAVFIGAWIAIHHGYLARGQIVDTPVYQDYGRAMADGDVPYRDFALEYPPGALPVFVLPVLGTDDDSDAFRHNFEVLMWFCGMMLLLGLAAGLTSLRVSRRRAVLALGLAALTPLLLGTVTLTRFDFYPAALVAWALAAFVAGRVLVGSGLLGVAFAAKIWPGVLLPLALAHVWRARGRRAALRCAGVFAAVSGLIVVPFFALSPGGVWHSVVRQVTRPLQIESLGAALVVVSHHVFGTGAEMVSSHGSQNLGGRVADILSAAQTVLQIAVVLGVWLWFARRPAASREEFIRASAAAVVAFVALGKVLSPQFLIWLVAVVPLVRRTRAVVLLGLGEVMTQIWFPRHYWDYALTFDTRISFVVLGRDVVLLALLAALLVPDWRTWDERQRARDRPYGATVVVRRGRECLLLHRAHEGPDYAGDWAWTPPSGARLPGEDVDDCARRELREETGLRIEPRRVSVPHDDWAYYVVDAPDDAEVTLDAEHDAYRWLTVEEAAALCRPERVAQTLLDVFAHERDVARTT